MRAPAPELLSSRSIVAGRIAQQLWVRRRRMPRKLWGTDQQPGVLDRARQRSNWHFSAVTGSGDGSLPRSNVDWANGSPTVGEASATLLAVKGYRAPDDFRQQYCTSAATWAEPFAVGCSDSSHGLDPKEALPVSRVPVADAEVLARRRSPRHHEEQARRAASHALPDVRAHLL